MPLPCPSPPGATDAPLICLDRGRRIHTRTPRQPPPAFERCDHPSSSVAPGRYVRLARWRSFVFDSALLHSGGPVQTSGRASAASSVTPCSAILTTPAIATNHSLLSFIFLYLAATERPFRHLARPDAVTISSHFRPPLGRFFLRSASRLQSCGAPCSAALLVLPTLREQGDEEMQTALWPLDVDECWQRRRCSPPPWAGL